MTLIHGTEISDSGLRAFDATARLGSFTGAAARLGVGQPAVSHAVARLERAVGSLLFERTGSGVSLTAIGRILHQRVSAGFDQIDLAVGAAIAGDATVTISVSASLATHWLLPRLPEFKRLHPTVELRVITTDTDRTVGQDDAHLWIPLGIVDRDDLEATTFCVEEVAPVAAPSVAATLRYGDLAALGAAPLLHLEERYTHRFDWPRWFRAHGMVALSLLMPAFGDHAEKISLVNEALKRTPNDPSLHVARAAWLYSVGRLKDAARALEIASLLDPLGPAVEGLRASMLSARGDVETAREIVSAAWARWPDSPFIWYLMWTTLCIAGDLGAVDALALPENVPRRGATNRDVEVLLNYAALLRLPAVERKAACERILDQMAASEEPLALSTCIFAAGHGCADRAFETINAALDAGRQLKPDNHEAFGMARSQAPLQLFVGATGEPIWKHARFPALCARLGLAQYWVETKKWPDCASETAYDFKAACAAAVAAA